MGEVRSQRVDWLVDQVKELSEKIEELRKDKNYDIDQVHSRMSLIDRYTQKTIGEIYDVQNKINNRLDVEIIRLHQENVQLIEKNKEQSELNGRIAQSLANKDAAIEQLKEEIKNLNNDIDMLWGAIDKGIK